MPRDETDASAARDQQAGIRQTKRRQSGGHRSAGNRPNSSQPSNNQPSGAQTVGQQTVGQQPAEHRPAEYQPTDFNAAINIADVAAERRRLTRNLIIMRAITLLLLIAAIGVFAFPSVLQYQSDRRLAEAGSASARNVAGWPYPQAEDHLNAARAYNKRLAASGQPILGEAPDPFAVAQGGSKANGKDDSAAAKDDEYQSLLDTGDGIMGTVRVPKQSIDLPIYHGTSDQVLASGAGHLYGTSLPVGGTSTHAVITGHRGLVEALMFTRLDEVVKGDFFYIEVMGETLGYQVDRISVILPNDVSQLKITPGEDRVTLMTCTPYGVNTHRLLISGHRVAIPVPAPQPGDIHDGRNIALAASLGTLIAGLAVAGLINRRHRDLLIMRHAAFWPNRRGEARQ